MSTTAVPARPSRGDELDLRIDSLAYGGAGVARLDGYVVFVRDAIPGDRVRAVVTKRKRAYAEARTVDVLEPSADRIPAVADHPGAPWQVLPYERQLEVKAEQVAEALHRIGRLDGFALEPIVPAVEQWRYRNKLEYSFGTGDDGTLVCGFHAPGSWERIVAVDDCLLASERGNAAREAALAWCRAQGIPAYDRRTQEGVLRNLVVREGRRTGELQVRLVTSPADLDLDGFAEAVGASSVMWTRAAGVGETTAGGESEVLHGTEAIDEELTLAGADLRFRLSAEAFFQTNTEMAEVLYGTAVEFAALQGWERVYDLFCGIGTIGLALAPRAGEVWGLEIVEEAIADAIANARRNDLAAKTRFFAGDVRLALRELSERAGRPDVLVVDPPHAAQLVEAGWTLRRVRPVDMFPQTPHIECVALLERT